MKCDSMNRQTWIDCAKAIAIMAVAVDHCNGMLYTNPIIAQASYFSVSLFVLLSGLTAWISDTYKPLNMKKALRKAGILYLQYAAATFVLVCFYKRFFDLKTYFDYLIHFSITGPFYFFVFFIQPVIISPILLLWCKYCGRQRYGWLLHIVTLMVLCFLSSVCIQYTYILPVHGGGQYLFGGTYIILYYIGMLLGRSGIFMKIKHSKMIILMISVLLWTGWLLGCYWQKLPFDRWMNQYWGKGFNPPSVQFGVFALITMFLLYASFSMLEESSIKIFRWLVCLFSWIGRYTLYIFMYHLMVRDVVFPYVNEVNKMIVRGGILAFALMIILPAIAADIVKKFKGVIREIAKNNSEHDMGNI